MKLQVFSIFDAKAEAFIQPWYSQTIGTAIRSFEQAVNQEGHDFKKFSQDYTLFHLGDFDQTAGVFTQLKSPLSLGLAIHFIKPADLMTAAQQVTADLRTYNDKHAAEN